MLQDPAKGFQTQRRLKGSEVTEIIANTIPQGSMLYSLLYFYFVTYSILIAQVLIVSWGLPLGNNLVGLQDFQPVKIGQLLVWEPGSEMGICSLFGLRVDGLGLCALCRCSWATVDRRLMATPNFVRTTWLGTVKPMNATSLFWT